MNLSSLLLDGEYLSATHGTDIDFTYLTHETERLSKGCLFICLRGVTTDTHYLAARITAASPAAVVVERESDFLGYPDTPRILVDSCRRTLALLWSRACGEPQKRLRMIGITGTNGKTSTAHLLAGILRFCGHRTALIGTVGCELDGVSLDSDEDIPGSYRARTMTTPDPDALYPYLKKCVDSGAEFAVMEVSSHSLALSKVDPIRFELAMFTNLSPEHLDFHADMEDYLSAKQRLFSQSDSAILNADDAASERIMRDIPCPYATCGVIWPADIRAEEITPLGERGTEYVLTSKEICEHVRISSPGDTSVYNSLMALSAAISLGIPPRLACEAIAELPGAEGRLELVQCDRDLGFTVMIDYAHTEAALRALLRTVRKMIRGDGRLILLFGCGGDRDRSKRAPMGAAAAELADISIVTSDNPRTEEPMRIILDILRGMPDRKRRRVILDRREAIGYAISIARPDDIVLLAGKGHEKYELVNNKRNTFDEREIVREAIRSQRNSNIRGTDK